MNSIRNCNKNDKFTKYIQTHMRHKTLGERAHYGVDSILEAALYNNQNSFSVYKRGYIRNKKLNSILMQFERCDTISSYSSKRRYKE